MATASTPPAWFASSGSSVMSRRRLSLWNTLSSSRWPSQCTSAVTWASGGVWPIRSQRSAEITAAPWASAKASSTWGRSRKPSLTLSWSAMDEIMRTMCWRSANSLRVLAWDSRDSICNDSTLANSSQAVRVRRSTGRGC
ncbi:hypothetical protein D3C76_735220 [compost metagenome]